MHQKQYSNCDARVIKTLTVPLFIFISLLFPLIASLSADAQGETEPDVSNEFCLNCHGNPGMATSLDSGETLLLGIDVHFFNNSIHGQVDIGCTKCHFDHSTFPHPALPDGLTLRKYTILRNESCTFCHSDISENMTGNAHEVAMDNGNLDAAVCTDCHGAHDTQPLANLRPTASETCKHCHSEIFELYSHSVHGEALFGEGNTDVPNCISCHDAHQIDGPSVDSSFHLFSPDICAGCHTNTDLMAKYDLNPNVMDSWIYDFHGKTVMLYQETAPLKDTDKAVCIDCHGVHDIRATDDPDSSVITENLLITCKKCHPGASANFADSWMGHASADFNKYPIVFFVTWFYRLLIPAIIGGMLLFVVTDYFRQIIDNRKERAHNG